MYKYFGLLLALSLGSSLNLKAQDLKKQFQASYGYFSPSVIVDTLGSNRLANAEIGHQELNLSAGIKLLQNEKSDLRAFIDYTSYNFSYSNWPNNVNTEERPENLHGLNLSVFFQQIFAESWRLALDIKPGLATDFSGGLSGEDFIFQGSARIQKLLGKNQSSWIGLGLSYNTLWGEAQLWPVLDLAWYPENGKFYLEAQAPFYGELAYLPIEKLSLGLTGRVKGNQFHFQGDGADEFQLNTVYGGLFADWNLAERLHLRLEGGLIANRTYEVRQDGEVKVDLDPDKFKDLFFTICISRYFE